MQTRLPESFLDDPKGKMADQILRSCVHCGFCTATCPTYQLTGDELDSPRGRIYLIKQMLEGQPVSKRTQIHLDRCLTCRACETTCPSGVEYGKLIDLGREWIETRNNRATTEKLLRWLLRKILPYPGRYAWLVGLARCFRPILPAKLKRKIPLKPEAGQLPEKTYTRKMFILNSCAQSVFNPDIDASTARVLDLFDIQLVRADKSACCGAIDQHLAAPHDAIRQMKANIDAWYSGLQNDVECILSNASGCGAHLKEYRHYFKNDPVYFEKAAFISSKTRDLGEIMSTLPLKDMVRKKTGQKISFHSPCTLQHGQQLNNIIEPLLTECGYELLPVKDTHLCCGSAGTYSVLQPEFSRRLLKNKLQQLNKHHPECIATANIGCLLHLQTQSDVPVVHWVTLIEEALITDQGTSDQFMNE